MHHLQSIIEAGFDDRANLSPKNVPADIKNAVNEIIELLDTGKLALQKNEWPMDSE